MPDDEEAKRAIAVLTVQKARSRGEFDDDDEATRKLRVKAQQQEEVTLEQQAAAEDRSASPKNLAHYLELAQFYINDERYEEAEELLAKAFEVSDGDPDVREKWEDAQLRHLRQKIAQAKDPEVKKKLQAEYFEKDVEVCKNRVERYPEQPRLQVRAWLSLHADQAVRRGDSGTAGGEERPPPKGGVHAGARAVFPAHQAVSSGDEPLRVGDSGDSRPRRRQ